MLYTGVSTKMQVAKIVSTATNRIVCIWDESKEETIDEGVSYNY